MGNTAFFLFVVLYTSKYTWYLLCYFLYNFKYCTTIIEADYVDV